MAIWDLPAAFSKCSGIEASIYQVVVAVSGGGTGGGAEASLAARMGVVSGGGTGGGASASLAGLIEIVSGGGTGGGAEVSFSTLMGIAAGRGLGSGVEAAMTGGSSTRAVVVGGGIGSGVQATMTSTMALVSGGGTGGGPEVSMALSMAVAPGGGTGSGIAAAMTPGASTMAVVPGGGTGGGIAVELATFMVSVCGGGIGGGPEPSFIGRIPAARQSPPTIGQRWLDHYDPIHRGVTPAGIAGGVAMRNGFAWGRPAGGYNLMRSTGSGFVPGDARAVGATSPTVADPATAKNFPGFAWPASAVCWLHVRALSPGGAADVQPPTGIRIETDADRVPLAPVPNPPARLHAEAVAGGYVRLSWRHDPAGEAIAPASWRIYSDAGAGQLDYDSVVATASGGIARVGAYAHGTTVRFGVRAVSSAGNEEENTGIVTVTVDAQGPADLPAPQLVLGVEI